MTEQYHVINILYMIQAIRLKYFCIYLLNENIKFNNNIDNINVMVLPQYYFIYYKNRLLIDEILYFENLQSDWEQLINKYNLNFNKKLYTKNKGRNTNYKKYYTDYTINIIKKYIIKIFIILIII